MESDYIRHLLEKMVKLLEAIEKNTRPETIEESKNQVKGFGVDK